MITMTTSTASAKSAAEFFERIAEIEALVAFARGGPAPKLPRFTSRSIAIGEADRALVARWARAFTTSIELLRNFRDAEVTSRAKATEEQVAEVLAGATEVLNALEKRLHRR